MPAAGTQNCLALCRCDIKGLTAWAEGVTVCGSKGEQVTGYWRKLHTEKLHGLYCALDTVRLIKWSGHVACAWRGMRKWLRPRNLRERDQFEESSRSQDNIKMCLRDGRVWPTFIWAEDRDKWRAVVNTVMNIGVS